MKQEAKQKYLRVLGDSLLAQLNGPMALFARVLDSSEESRLRIALQNAFEESLQSQEFTAAIHG